MSQKVTLGGDRLGSGNKQKVEMHGFERSTHDLSYTWRTTMSPGTLVPFLSEVALPGDTFDIDLDCDIRTHPTIGPLFGSFKVQLDIFVAPMRLYISALHNNTLGIGNRMQDIELPKVELFAKQITADNENLDSWQIHPSSIWAYLDIMGVGLPGQEGDTGPVYRKFNAIPFLMYWEIYKNYYSNKQEEAGYVIHNSIVPPVSNIASMTIDGNAILQAPASGTLTFLKAGDVVVVTTTAPADDFNKDEIVIFALSNILTSLEEATTGWIKTGASTFQAVIKPGYEGRPVSKWDFVQNYPNAKQPVRIESFPLQNIDLMRQDLLAEQFGAEFIVNDPSYIPYQFALEVDEEELDWSSSRSQEGLGIKTYQSDLFNNWLSTDWIDGTGGINEITAVDTSSGSFNIDALNLSKKVYDMLNRIAVSGGTYDDWLRAVYDHESYTRAESPVYMGGLIKELVFQEVVSQAQDGGQPLGTLAGKGVLTDKHKGGKVYIKIDEPSYIMGIISLTPRLDYSQGNKWDVNLSTLNDLHKPSLDGIGFQELITEQMAWWTTKKVFSAPNTWETKSAGKQPAWINYMTNVNKVRGNFAIPGNEGFMVLTRRYEPLSNTGIYDYSIKDLTTYIDPTKFNHIFADTSLDAQNFWTQIRVEMIARRKMSAKVMPNL